MGNGVLIMWGALFLQKQGPGLQLFPHPPDRPRQNAGAGREAGTLAQGTPPLSPSPMWQDATRMAPTVVGDHLRPVPPYTTDVPGETTPGPVGRGGDRTEG